MKTSTLNIWGIVLLCFISGKINAQIVITPSGVQKITESSVNLTLNDYKGNIQWQRSEDETTWEDIAGATNASHEVTADESWSYRAKVTVDACNLTYYSETTTIHHDYNLFDLENLTVGSDDYTSGFWSSFSDFFSVPTDRLLHMEFINHNSGVEGQYRWNNWALVMANEEANTSDATRTDLVYNADYLEYFVLRADVVGWGWQMAGVDANYAYDANLLASEGYPGEPTTDNTWDEFNAVMNGATVVIEVDHSVTGNVYITATATGTDGTVMTLTYQQPVSTTDDIVAFLTCENSYLEMKTAYLAPSRVSE